MSVTIISNEDLKKLNNGKTVNLDFGPFSVTIASEKWIERMEKSGNIRNEHDKKIKEDDYQQGRLAAINDILNMAEQLKENNNG